MRYKYKIYNAKGKLISTHIMLSRACDALGIKHDTVRKHFHRYPKENSYGVFNGIHSLGKLKYIIIREAVNENK